MAVGVPENDVFTAADAVLARGERPTVERVRLELGRGSPARVGALLDQWWEQLAERLRGEMRLPGLPAEVAQAFIAIWQQATTLAQGVAEQSLASQRQVLADEREQVAAQEVRARLDAAQARQQAAEALAARQVTETRLGDLEQLLVQRQAQIDDLRQQRQELLGQRDEAREQLVECRQHQQNTRLQAEEAREAQQRYTRDVEDRAYREIDRAREESKGLAAQLKDANVRAQTLQHALQAGQRDLTDARAQRANAETQSQTLHEKLDQVRQACTAAGERGDALQHGLQQVQGELAEAQRNVAAQQARADTLETQLGQLRDVLQSKRKFNRT
ncbi:DNA-binding protein [Pseudomonas yamanorum]|uniref:DNA-binding protein n=1 Tax=Pseudomonas yamanorum TaxID=515393 RepID=A0ABU1CNV7_9PSED|nr:DNA-binding protein [Pseudomonas yamanorum]MDR0188953.1 DNA-binding protein [Pseudomonas yamanorum]